MVAAVQKARDAATALALQDAEEDEAPVDNTMEELTTVLLDAGLAPSRGWLRGAFSSSDTSGGGVLDAEEMGRLQVLHPATQPAAIALAEVSALQGCSVIKGELETQTIEFS